jgi:hypothetical protein
LPWASCSLGHTPADDVAARTAQGTQACCRRHRLVSICTALSRPLLANPRRDHARHLFSVFGRGPANGPTLIGSESALVLTLVIFLAATVLGGVTGYGIGVRMAAGMPVRSALAGSRIIMPGHSPAVNRVMSRDGPLSCNISVLVGVLRGWSKETQRISRGFCTNQCGLNRERCFASISALTSSH